MDFLERWSLPDYDDLIHPYVLFFLLFAARFAFFIGPYFL